MNRSTAIGYLFRSRPQVAREEFVQALRECGGSTEKVAHSYGVTQRQVQRIVRREGLCDVVRAAQLQARAPANEDLDRRALDALGG